jgi:hypothetical protein
MTADGMNSKNPKRSSCGMTLRTSAIENASFFGSSGMLMSAKMTAARPPVGRLM